MHTLQSIVYTVRDLDAAKAVHTTLLGTEPHTDQPYYVGFNVGGVEIGLTPGQDAEADGTPIVYVGVADLEASVAEVLAAGATLVAAPKDVGGGTRLATVTDANGSTLGLIQHG